MQTRQEIYDRIRETSRDEYILEEMIRLGFWPKGEKSPDKQDPADEIRRKGELERRLRELTKENRKLKNTEGLRRAARKRRLQESRQKRKENKARRLQKKAERANTWKLRQQSEISYLGQSVSKGLNHQKSDSEKLRDQNLPVIQSVNELASAMEISVGELRFLAFHRRTSTTTHYQRFAIPKKTGGVRNISAPMPRLKRIQEWILFNILEKIELHPAAHGFRRGRSIITNAEPHVKSDVVINVDMENYFPTVTYQRVRGMFKCFGYSEQLATILALICSEPEVAEVLIDNQTYYVKQSERFLPQGAPSSPAITNIICRGMDARLAYHAKDSGFTYTRYADDITFSGSSVSSEKVGRILRRTRYVVEQEGFKLHPEKTRIFRKGSRQEVTGLVVNEKVSVSRKTLRQFRATLFQIEKDGPAGKKWGNTSNVLESIEGYSNFVAMVDPEKGAVFQQRVMKIIDKYGRSTSQHAQRQRWRSKVKENETEMESQAESSPARKKKPWWKFW